MKGTIAGFLIALGVLIATQAKAKDAPFVIGDSICEGIMLVAGAPGYARRGAKTLHLTGWIASLPERSAVIFCSGTNDAAAGLYGFVTAIEDVVRIARAKQLKLIWIGPVRTSHRWDRYSDQADTLLALRLDTAGVRYVSLRAIKFERADLAGDGVHFSSRGYRRIASMVLR